MTSADSRPPTLKQKIGQMFFIGIPGPEIDAATRDLLEAIQPGGVCLFARNVRSAEQCRELTDALRDLLVIEPLISIDQEGGLVDRLRRILGPMPAAASIKTADDAERHARIIADALRTLGINMDFAPVVDVIDESRVSGNNGLFSRGFGRSESEAVEFAGRFLASLSSGGVLGCLKHFPGLGATTVDSHEELPTVNITVEELFGRDLLPYRELFASNNKTPVMVAHAAYPNVYLQEKDQDGKLLPSSLSFNFVTELLRKEMNFEGVAITDDLEMGAILKNYGIGEACVMAVEAGEDMLAICAGIDSIYEGFRAVNDAVESNRISEERITESVARIAETKSNIGEPLPFDPKMIAALSTDIADFNALLG